MAVLPGSLALTVIPDGSPIIAADHRNNYGSVQTATNALIAILDNGNGIDGDALVWDATLSKWSAASRLAAGRPRPPRVVTSPMSGGPPASPVDQDIWVATAVDGAGTRWHFQYNAGSASTYKWEFIGGSPLRAFAAADVGCAVGAGFSDDAATRITIPRAGDYRITVSVSARHAAAGQITIQAIRDGSGTFTNFGWTAAGITDSDVRIGVSGEITQLGAGAGAYVNAGGQVNSGSAFTGFRTVKLTPVRII